jgi:hypothetical protein
MTAYLGEIYASNKFVPLDDTKAAVAHEIAQTSKEPSPHWTSPAVLASMPDGHVQKSGSGPEVAVVRNAHRSSKAGEKRNIKSACAARLSWHIAFYRLAYIDSRYPFDFQSPSDATKSRKRKLDQDQNTRQNCKSKKSTICIPSLLFTITKISKSKIQPNSKV